jgi:hypothetical protein
MFIPDLRPGCTDASRPAICKPYTTERLWLGWSHSAVIPFSKASDIWASGAIPKCAGSTLKFLLPFELWCLKVKGIKKGVTGGHPRISKVKADPGCKCLLNGNIRFQPDCPDFFNNSIRIITLCKKIRFKDFHCSQSCIDFAAWICPVQPSDIQCNHQKNADAFRTYYGYQAHPIETC